MNGISVAHWVAIAGLVFIAAGGLWIVWVALQRNRALDRMRASIERERAAREARSGMSDDVTRVRSPRDQSPQSMRQSDQVYATPKRKPSRKKAK
jgi:hypothetical protein